jgi:hypothetical protein
MLLSLLLRLSQRRTTSIAVTVAAVRAGDEVIVSQGGDGPHRHRLLPGVEVRGPLDQVPAQQIIDLGLEHTDLPHLSQEVQRTLLAESVLPQVELFGHRRTHLPHITNVLKLR